MNSSVSRSSKMKNQSGGKEAFPEMIRPLIVRKLKELMNRRKIKNGGPIGGGGEAAIYEKRLVKDGAAKDEGDGINSAPVVCAETKISKVVPLPVSKCTVEVEEKHAGHKNYNKEQEKVVKCVEKKHENVNKKHEEEEDEDENENENEIGRFIGPGSPSFRIYCVEPVKKNEEEKYNEIKGDDEKQIIFPIIYQKTPSDVSFESVESAPNSSNDEATSKPVEIKPNAQSTTGMELATKSKGPTRKKIISIKLNMLNPKTLSIKNRINPMFSCTGISDKNRDLPSPN